MVVENTRAALAVTAFAVVPFAVAIYQFSEHPSWDAVLGAHRVASAR